MILDAQRALRQSLRWRLLMPMVGAWATLTVVAAVGFKFETERRLEQSLLSRAQILANLVNYSAESVSTAADLQRFVTKAAAEPDVAVIAVVAGEPARVVASSRAAWIGLELTELPLADIADDLTEASSRRETRHYHHRDAHRFDYGTPLLLSLPTLSDGSLAQGAVALHLDTQALQDDIRRSLFGWLTLILLGAGAVTAAGYRVLRRRVLRPIAVIGEAVRARREDDDAVWAGADTGDELGALATTLRQSIVARTRSETALRHSERMASVGSLAGGVAHEIHTPLQFVNDSVHFLREGADDALRALEGVRQVLQTLQRDATPEELRDALSAIAGHLGDADLDYLVDYLPKASARSVEGVERVQAIIRSLKACADTSTTDLRADDVNRAVKNAVTVIERECLRVSLLGVEFGELPPVVCRVGDIYDTVLQLLYNAIDAVARAHPPSAAGALATGRISVRTWKEGDEVVITVTDNGDGIPDAIAGRVFDPFFTTKEVGRGSGQGLAVAWSIVTERHGGQLSFVSPPGGGTIFTMRLPIAGPGAAARGVAA